MTVLLTNNRIINAKQAILNDPSINDPHRHIRNFNAIRKRVYSVKTLVKRLHRNYDDKGDRNDPNNTEWVLLRCFKQSLVS